MGRGKKKLAAKRKEKMEKRILIRKKMGKPIFFTLTNCHKKLSGISNKYNYKANMHNLCFVKAYFYNVKYQASIMTGCNFRDAHMIGIDFYNCNMRDTSFKNTLLENVIFYNCNLKNVDFLGTRFLNVTFICTNLNIVKNFKIDTDNITILRTYPKIDINISTVSELTDLSNNKTIFNSRVLHVNKNKLNNWTLSLIYSRYGEKGLLYLAKILQKKEKWRNLNTVFSYILLIENKKNK